MKKYVAFLLALLLLFTATSAFATEYYQYKNRREVPASVYREPYQESQYALVYAPWLKVLHLMNNAQLARGEYGGEACQVLRAWSISPVNPDVMYFGTDTTGIFKSSNGGKSWYNTSNSYPGHYSQGLLCDIFDENIVYYVARKGSVARSRDGGKNWEEIIPDKSDFGFLQTLLTQDGSGNLYAAIPSGIYKLDRATDKVVCLYDKFQSVTGNKGIYFFDIEVSKDGQHIYACARVNTNDNTALPGLYVSHDGGKTWGIKGTDDEKLFGSETIALHPEDPMRIFAGGVYKKRASGEDIGNYMLYESTDGGNTLTERFLVTYENLEEGVSRTPKTFYYMDFGPKENGVYPLYLVGQSMTFNYLVSYDYGASFKRILPESSREITEKNSTARYPLGSSGYTGWQAQPYAIHPVEHNKMFISNMGPAIVDINTGEIEHISAGFSGVAAVHIALDSQQRPFIATCDSKGFTWESGSFKEGDHFTVNAIKVDSSNALEKGLLSFEKAVFDPNDDDHIIAYVSPGNNAQPDYCGVRQSFDKGKTWEPMNPETIFAKGEPNATISQVLQYDVDDKNIIYNSFTTSYDNGKTWVPNEKIIMAINKDGTKFLGREGYDKQAKYYLSEDKGKTWKYVLTPGYYNDYKGVFFDDIDENYVWFGRRYGIYRYSLLDGSSVNHLDKLGFRGLNILRKNPERPGHIIALSAPGAVVSDDDFKIAESRDNGKTWHIVPGGWGGYFCNVQFINDKAYILGSQGTFEYDYKKYWQFLEDKITVQLDGEEVSFSVMPEIKEGRTMVPMRELFEMLGANVSWNGETREVTATKGGSAVKLQIDNTTVNMNGTEKQMEAAPYIVNGRTMVPLRFASEALGIRVGWDATNKLIIMISK